MTRFEVFADNSSRERVSECPLVMITACSLRARTSFTRFCHRQYQVQVPAVFSVPIGDDPRLLVMTLAYLRPRARTSLTSFCNRQDSSEKSLFINSVAFAQTTGHTNPAKQSHAIRMRGCNIERGCWQAARSQMRCKARD